jgi:outer membrane immunogenic protein
VRADRVQTRFGTRWLKGGNRSADIDRDDRVDGNRIGVGAQLPLTRTLFTRLDYSYTEYDDYGFTTTHGQPDSMRFKNSETLFRLALGAFF